MRVLSQPGNPRPLPYQPLLKPLVTIHEAIQTMNS